MTWLTPAFTGSASQRGDRRSQLARFAAEGPQSSDATVQPERPPTVAVPPGAQAWLRAAQRQALGKPDSAAYWEAAWHGTDAFWLRPVTYVVAWGICFCAFMQHPHRIHWKVRKPTKKPRDLIRVSPIEEAGQENAKKVLKALQHLELPFFATGSTWSEIPVQGIKVTGNLREGALDNCQAVLQLLEKRVHAVMDRPFHLHLLKTDAKAAGRSQEFELLVRDVPNVRDVVPQNLFYFSASLAIAAFVAANLGTSNFLQAAGSVIAEGHSLPLAPLAAILAAGEVCRSVVARSHGVTLSPRMVVPSPQVGVLGIFSTPLTPPKSKQESLELSVASPLGMTAASFLLILAGMCNVGGEPMELHSGFDVAFLLSQLPNTCNSLVWAGAQGLLMASLALLPNSPDGRGVYSVLLGRPLAKKISDVTNYAYPLVAMLASTVGVGYGWTTLPLWWAFMLFNLAPPETTPALEEASEPRVTTRIVATLLVAGSVICAFPGPLFELAPALLSAAGAIGGLPQV